MMMGTSKGMKEINMLVGNLSRGWWRGACRSKITPWFPSQKGTCSIFNFLPWAQSMLCFIFSFCWRRLHFQLTFFCLEITSLSVSYLWIQPFIFPSDSCFALTTNKYSADTLGFDRVGRSQRPFCWKPISRFPDSLSGWKSKGALNTWGVNCVYKQLETRATFSSVLPGNQLGFLA